VGLPGFEPESREPESLRNACFSQKSLNLGDFKDFCVVDLGLAESTAKRHVERVEKLLEFVGDGKTSRIEIRSYLKSVKEGWSSSKYRNVLASLVRFYRDYLGMKDVVDSFKFPSRSFKPITVPSKDQLQRFYQGLKSDRDRALFLMYASSGLRRNEVIGLKLADVDFEKRMLMPKKEENKSKHVWLSFYNDETGKMLLKYLSSATKSDRLFDIANDHASRIFKNASKSTGIKVTPQVLREWFCCEMANLGVQDRFVDAFCGRTPKSVLARHYTDYSPERLKEIYDKAELNILD